MVSGSGICMLTVHLFAILFDDFSRYMDFFP